LVKRIDSVKNPQVKLWKKLHTKKERDNQGLFLVEGFHLVEEALNQREMIKHLIVADNVDIPSHWNVDTIEIIVVTSAVIKAIADTETPQGIAAVCYQNQSSSVIQTARRLVLLDAVQDPGNVGTIIRTAEAAGIDAVIIGEGCVDVYNSKVIRSTQGAIFNLPVIKKDLISAIKEIKELGINVYGTSLQNASVYTEVEKPEAFALIVGNEGNGVSSTVLSETDQNLYIPIFGKSESLNVAIASAILMYYLRGM